jgi:ankyrin repeat protein
MKINDYARQGNIAGVQQLLASGVEIDSRDRALQTPLMSAVSSANANLEMVQFLVENGADVNAIGGESSYAALGFAANDPVLGFAVKSGNIDKIQYLLNAGADIRYQRLYDYDVLMDAMCSPNISKNDNLTSIIKLLISRGANVRNTSQNGESALKFAAYEGRFDVIELLLEAGADREQLQWTELMEAIVFGSVEETKQLIDAGADLAALDFCWRTPWIFSLQVGEIEKVKLLLASGANEFDGGETEKPPLMYVVENNHAEVLEYLIQQGFDANEVDRYNRTLLIEASERGATECVRVLLAAGVDASVGNNNWNSAIYHASNLEIIKMLVDAGEDLSDINDDMRQLLTGLGSNREILNIDQEQYLSGKSRRFGTANPEVMTVEFWQAMARSSATAWTARNTFDDPDNAVGDEAVWCFQRFGRTITQLPDRRIIQIGGEHEDYYDPDFCIYNDVTVHQQDGTFAILGYPKEIFPPTDFHSATLVGDYIYIIGCLGYIDNRIYDETPVYRLDCQTLSIEKIETTGEKPGWISRHNALYTEPSRIYITGGKISVRKKKTNGYIDNINNYMLDLSTLNWSRVTN